MCIPLTCPSLRSFFVFLFQQSHFSWSDSKCSLIVRIIVRLEMKTWCHLLEPSLRIIFRTERLTCKVNLPSGGCLCRKDTAASNILWVAMWQWPCLLKHVECLCRKYVETCVEKMLQPAIHHWWQWPCLLKHVYKRCYNRQYTTGGNGLACWNMCRKDVATGNTLQITMHCHGLACWTWVEAFQIVKKHRLVYTSWNKMVMMPTFSCSLTLPFRTKLLSKPFPKCRSQMEPKIRVMQASSNSSIVTMFMWRVMRLEMSLRPPPGGPIAETSSCDRKIQACYLV